jgi:hypothetical protein
MRQSFELPIKTVSEANCTEHWTTKSKRHKAQQFVIRCAFKQYVQELDLPCTVNLIRIAPRELDDDNLVMSFKWIRDELSECILPEKKAFYVTKEGSIKDLKGRADSDPQILWKYLQEKNKEYGIRVEIDF